MKRVYVEAFLPDLKGQTDFGAAGSGSTVKAALSRAVGEILKHPKIRGRRLHSMKLTVAISEAAKPKLVVEEELGIGAEEGVHP